MSAQIKAMPRRCVWLLLALLAGCASSPPAHFYTLVPSASAVPVASAPFVIDVQSVSVPVSVDRPQLVIRQGDGSVALLEKQRWIAPLEDELRSALGLDLAQQLHSMDVHDLPAASSKPVYALRVDVQRFESVPASHILLAADWSVQQRDDEATAIGCSSTVRQGVASADYAALVRAHQQAVQQLAAQMAKVVQALAAGQSTNCPQAGN